MSSELRRRNSEAGFTLIELLVSLAILSVALALLGAGLRIFSKNWEESSRRTEVLDMISRAYDILHRDVSGLQRLPVTDGQSTRYLFSGTREVLSFVTIEPPYPSEGGPYFVSYSTVGQGREAVLARSRAPYQQGMMSFPGATPANQVALYEGSALSFRFSYATVTAGPGGWSPSWPYSDRLPDLVRLEIIDMARQQPVSPPLIVAVRTDAELNCLEEKSALCSPGTGGTLKEKTRSHEDEMNPSDNTIHEQTGFQMR